MYKSAVAALPESPTGREIPIACQQNSDCELSAVIGFARSDRVPHPDGAGPVA